MATAGKIRGWSIVGNSLCFCGQKSCKAFHEQVQAQRERLIAAQEMVFDEPTRAAGVQNPIRVFDLTAAA